MKLQPKILGPASVVFFLVLGGLPFGPTAATPQLDGDDVVASLREGKSAFWDGPFVDGPVTSPQFGLAFSGLVRGRAATCEGGAQCYDSLVEVVEPGHRLRVAADTSLTATPAFDLAVYGPDCGPQDVTCPEYLSMWVDGNRLPGFTQEVFVDNPAAGTYLVRAALYETGLDFQFRFRAKLEAQPKEPNHVVLQPPDLRPEPPYNLFFGSFDGQGAALLGSDDSCNVPEAIETRPQRCLRLAFGWQNLGPGPFDLRFREYTEDPLQKLLAGQVDQRVYSSDGTFTERPAGDYVFHATHTHYHYNDFVKLELFEVVDSASGKLADEPVAEGTKLGTCGHDWKMAEWRSFDQAVVGSHDSGTDCLGTGRDAVQPHVGLSVGWLDVYGAGTIGNFIDIGDAPDGEYLVVFSVDFNELLLERDDSNNVAYGHIRISGDAVELLERGVGESPWDPHKEVFPLLP